MSATSSGETTVMDNNNAESATADLAEAAECRSNTPSPRASEPQADQQERSADSSGAPPLPDELPPPLPNEALPDQAEEDDGWAPVWDDNAQAFYFVNRFTNVSQWENPRV